MIEVTNLVRRYGEFAAVDDVSFSIAPGEVVGLLGHNGAGKTTIMKMLTGFLEPSAGQICVGGEDVWAHPEAIQSQLGYLPENSPLYPELRVIDYLSYAAELRGLDPVNCVADAVSATALQEKVLDPISTLSRGFKQRVGVAQAILHQPKVLILDEPSNGLDPTQTQHMRDLIRNLAQHATVILSTHIMQEVNAVCDRVLILRQGRLVIDERLDDLRQAAGLLLHTQAGAKVGECLGSLDVVEGVQQASEGNWVIHLRDDTQSSANVVATALVAAAIPIFSLSPRVRDLEAVFREVTEAATVAHSSAQEEAHHAA